CATTLNNFDFRLDHALGTIDHGRSQRLRITLRDPPPLCRTEEQRMTRAYEHIAPSLEQM
ncbi:MAG: hypothetical protein ACTIJ6_11420, partial [Leucobacter sp.]